MGAIVVIVAVVVVVVVAELQQGVRGLPEAHLRGERPVHLRD